MADQSYDEHADSATNSVTGTPTSDRISDESGPSIESSEIVSHQSRPGESYIEAKDSPDVRTRTPETTKPLWRVWALEMASIILSVALLVAIIVVFSRYDQQSLPDWPLAITLNTFVAFFSMASKAAFMVPVSIAISQGQWDWFRQERPLYDFYVFDQASRGPWGALMLLRRVHLRHFVSLGALLMIVSVLSSPVTQLAISYPIRDVAVPGEATVPATRSVYYSPLESMKKSTQKALILATATDSDQFSSSINPPATAVCSTGNCTYETYTSLSVCVKMANISSQLQIKKLPDYTPLGIKLYDNTDDPTLMAGGGPVWEASLPGSLVLAHQSGFAMIMDNINGNGTFGFKGEEDLLRSRIASFILIYSKPIFQRAPSNEDTDAVILKAVRGVQHEAIEVLFHLCVQSYRTTVKGGQETTEIVSSVTRPSGDKHTAFFDMNCTSILSDASGAACELDESRTDNKLYLEPPPSTVENRMRSLEGDKFGVDYYSLATMSENLKNGLQTHAFIRVHPTLYPDGDLAVIGQDMGWRLFDTVLFSKASLSNFSVRDRRVDNIFNNIATLLSAQLRTRESQDRDTQSMFNITGQAWERQSYVHINWGWISFLVVEILLAAGFLTLTIVCQSRQQKQGGHVQSYMDTKDSSLAHLVALGDQCRMEMSGVARTMDELERFARDFKVKLREDEVVPSQEAEER